MPTLHVLGDSISQRYGPYLKVYLKGVLDYSRKEGMPGDPAEPNGTNGGDSALVLRYLQACHERDMHWDYLLLNCGLHDLRTNPKTRAKQVEPDLYLNNLRQIVPAARALARHIIWVRTTPVADAIHNALSASFHRFAVDVDDYNALADTVMAEAGIPRIDLFDFTRKLGDDPYVDHVHYKENVCQMQAAYIAGYLVSVVGRAL